MNLTTMRARVRRLTGIQMTSLLADADIDTVINEVYREVLAIDTWPFLHVDVAATALAGNPSVTVPSPVRTVTSVRVDGKNRLQQTTIDHLDVLADEDTSTGEPELYAFVNATTLKVWPTPDVNYSLQVRGYKDEAALTANDEPVFDSVFHVLLPYEASVRILQEQGDDESGRVPAYREQVATMLQSMSTMYLRAHDRKQFRMGTR